VDKKGAKGPIFREKRPFDPKSWHQYWRHNRNPVKKAKQTLINTKDKMMIELASAAPNPTSIELTKQAIKKKSIRKQLQKYARKKIET
jgi:hypothetical protein